MQEQKTQVRTHTDCSHITFPMLFPGYLSQIPTARSVRWRVLAPQCMYATRRNKRQSTPTMPVGKKRRRKSPVVAVIIYHEVVMNRIWRLKP